MGPEVKPRRRRLLRWMAALGGSALALRIATPRLARFGPLEALGEQAEFVERCLAGLDRALLWDVHAHVVGTGSSGSGCEVASHFSSHLHPWMRFQYEMYLAGSGVTDVGQGDEQYIERLFALHRQANPAGRLILLAFDRAVGEDGVEREDGTAFHAPNEYVLALAQEHPDMEAGLSIHPYRPDALERLEAGVRAGARLVKWLPSSMGIDPDSARCDAFYERLAAFDLPLLSHAGRELAVPGGGAQELGNPLRLRRALDAGVRVIVAHCASDGVARAENGAPAEAFDLFLGMLREPRWEGRLFGGISALTLLNRSGDPLRHLLRSGELHPRLVNGSDYPMCALRPLVSPKALELRGYLDAEDRRACQRLLSVNPLLADLAIKRCLRVVEGGREHRFMPSVFETGRLFRVV